MRKAVIARLMSKNLADLNLRKETFRIIAQYVEENFVHRSKVSFEMQKCFVKVLGKAL